MSEYNSNPIIRTRGGAEYFLKRHREAEQLHSCYLGHVQCSTHLHGPCLDETLANFDSTEEKTNDQ
jgi:hypothetical protein